MSYNAAQARDKLGKWSKGGGSFSKTAHKEYVRSLDYVDRSAFFAWSANGYEQIRKCQGKSSGCSGRIHLEINRDGDEKGFSTAEIAARMQKLVTQGPQYKGTVFRGLELKPSEVAKLKPGKVLKMKALTSTSRSSRVAMGFADSAYSSKIPVVLKLITKSGLALNRRLTHMPEEREVIIPKGRRYKIHAVGRSNKRGGEYHVIVAKEI